MNANTIKAAIAALTQAVEALTVIIGELTTATETTTEATTTETATTTTTPIIVLDDDDNVITTTETTTEATTTTETATTTTTATDADATEKAMIKQDPCDPIPADPTEIIVIDDDDNVVATGSLTPEVTTTTSNETTGSLPCPPKDVETTTTETAEADATPAEATTTETATSESVTETTVNGVTTARKAVTTTEDDLVNIYEIIKYILRHEGVNSGIDKSIYAPDKNIHVSFNNDRYKMYLSLHDNELVVMLTKEENVIMKMMTNLSSIEIVTVDEEIEALASNARINTVIDVMSSAIDLIK